jgi:hypothetical protein
MREAKEEGAVQSSDVETEWSTAAQDRDGWRNVVEEAKVTTGCSAEGVRIGCRDTLLFSKKE